MSRSGYSDDSDEGIGLWRGAVKRAIEGKRGQAFLRELAEAMDAMPEKKLIKDALIADGCFCTLGVVGAARGIDMSAVNHRCAEALGKVFGISRAMAAEIEFMKTSTGITPFHTTSTRATSSAGSACARGWMKTLPPHPARRIRRDWLC